MRNASQRTPKDEVFNALMHSKLWWCNLAFNENWIIGKTLENIVDVISIDGEGESGARIFKTKKRQRNVQLNALV